MDIFLPPIEKPQGVIMKLGIILHAANLARSHR
jgi:hypothetical protein